MPTCRLELLGVVVFWEAIEVEYELVDGVAVDYAMSDRHLYGPKTRAKKGHSLETIT